MIWSGSELADNAHDVGFFHDQQVFAVDLDFGTGPFAEQNAVADFDVKRNQLCRFRRGHRNRQRRFRLQMVFPERYPE